MFKASIVIPCYNEEQTLKSGFERLRAIADDDMALEIIIVDDCSKDRSREIARELADAYPEVKLCFHEVNQGKGAALRTGFKEATGDVVAVQDADLEYDPNDLRELIELIRLDTADVVMGSRFLSRGAHRVLYFWHSMGNRFLTFLSNMLTDLNLTDMETCYKVFRRDIIQDIKICENRFGFEPEIVAKVARKHPRIYELGVSYAGRTYEEGKKIGIRDGFRALYCILHYNAPFASMPLQLLMFAPLVGLAGLTGVLFYLLGLMVNLEPGVAAIPAYAVFAIPLAVASRHLIFPKGDALPGQVRNILTVATVALGFFVDWGAAGILKTGAHPWVVAKFFSLLAAGFALFLSWRYVVFPQTERKPEADADS